MAISGAVDADPEETEAALEAAIAACPDIDVWMDVAERHATAFEEFDPMAFLTDRCVNGPPDLAETALCESLNVER